MATFEVYVTRVTTYRVEADDEQTAKNLALLGGGEEIDQDTQRVDAEQQYDVDDVVQVVFEHRSGTTSSPYAYLVPDGIDVRVGDLVVVPPTGSYRVTGALARVVQIGPGGYSGPMKTILGRVETPEPAEHPASETCPDCGYEGEIGATVTPCRGTMS